jgi:hypothetical protein
MGRVKLVTRMGKLWNFSNIEKSIYWDSVNYGWNFVRMGDCQFLKKGSAHELTNVGD